MLDPDSRHGRELKAAEEFFALARTTPVPFMRSYYQRVAERYLSSVGELRAVGPSAGITGRFPGPPAAPGSVTAPPAAAEPASQSAAVTPPAAPESATSTPHGPRLSN
jgi:hypothetical protein